MDVRECLESLGYRITSSSNGWARMRPLYRDSDNDGALSVNLATGSCRDFVLAKSFSFKYLISLTKGLQIKDAEEWVKNLNVSFSKSKEIQIRNKENPLPKSMIHELKRDYSYWNNRGISDHVLDKFDCGVCNFGELWGRFVFRIYSSRNRIVGLDGRDLLNDKSEKYKKRHKWKKIGKKNDWYFPRFNDSEVEEGTIILVESIGDMLSLMECGIYNCIPCFSLDMSNMVFYNLIKLNPKKIIISLNNDENNRGQDGMIKMKKKLDDFFSNVIIKCPPENDYNEILTKKGKKSINEFLGF